MLPLKGTTETCKDIFLQSILDALVAMERRFVDLSKLKWDGIDKKGLITFFKKQRVQERPYAYEFYHQFRKLWEDCRMNNLGFAHTTTQAEVHKGYQDIPNLKKMPDLLVHMAGSKLPEDQVAVIEFKLASNKNKTHEDFDKLINFRQFLLYQYAIEIIIGNEIQLLKAQKYIAKRVKGPKIHQQQPIVIHVIYFDCEVWRAMIEQREYK